MAFSSSPLCVCAWREPVTRQGRWQCAQWSGSDNVCFSRDTRKSGREIVKCSKENEKKKIKRQQKHKCSIARKKEPFLRRKKYETTSACISRDKQGKPATRPEEDYGGGSRLSRRKSRNPPVEGGVLVDKKEKAVEISSPQASSP